MKGDRIRIKDIADELGLSTATVSNVIHGKTKKISDETVKRVQNLVEKRQYIPNMAGILLAQNSSKIVGIIIHDFEKYEGHVLEDAFVAASLNALSREINEAGFFMMVRVTADWNEIVRIASMWNMEGLVLIGFCEKDYQKLRESMHIPFVVYDGYFEETQKNDEIQKICNLIIDDYDGGYQVGTYLRQMGHEKVLCIADNYLCMDKDRIDGCRVAVEEQKVDQINQETAQRHQEAQTEWQQGTDDMDWDCIQAPQDKVGKADFLQVPMAEEERKVFYETQLPYIMEHTAVFAVSDFYAIELIHFLQKHGKRVPEDISVIGFDDVPWCEKISPALTTVRQDSAERAKQAIRILQELRNGDYSTTTVKLPVWLVERDSVRKIG